jgi:hypothetical protein
MTRRRAGLTLIEMLVTTGLSAIVVGGAMYALVMCFRANRVIEDELDMLDNSLLTLSRIAGEASLSRGLVRFTPDGETDPKDGLLVRGSKIVLYELDGGSLRRSVYGADFKLIDATAVGRGLSYFELVAIERGLHLRIQAGLDPETRSPLPPERTVDLVTSVRAMFW